MTTDQTDVIVEHDEDEPDSHDCARDGCTYEILTNPGHGPTTVVCTGTCGRSWPVGRPAPAEDIIGYLAVKARGNEGIIWSAPKIRTTHAEAEGDRAFWQQSHTTMNRGLTLGVAKVVLLDQPGQ